MNSELSDFIIVEGGLKNNNYPIPITSLVGRQKEVVEIARILTNARLLTLLGPGGVGKTRLAIEVAHDTASNYQNGVYWVDLALLINPLLIPQTIANALDIYVAPDKPPYQAIENYLQTKHLLLVLDNCEHLAAPIAKLVEQLLTVCPRLHILTASREELGIYGEVTWHVPPLPYPNPQSLPPLENMMEYPSIQLFVERAAAISPEYGISELNYQSIAQICQKLDGIPLAIELAAARIKLFSAAEIASRLTDRFEILTGGSRNALPRQQTLRATLDWSYELLEQPEQRLFWCLSVFADCFSLDAAEQVALPMLVSAEGINFLDLLTKLVNKSLIEVETELMDPKIGSRYHLLETVREYAREKLKNSGETNKVHTRYLNYYRQFMEGAEPKLYNQEQSTWLNLIEVERDNLRTAIEWALENNAREAAEQIIIFMGQFWQLRGYFTEAAMWLDRILAMPGIADANRAKLLLSRGHVAESQGAYEQAKALVDTALELFTSQGDAEGIAHGRTLLGIIDVFQGKREDGIKLLEESLKSFQESGNEWETAMVLLFISDTYGRMGYLKKAAILGNECLQLFKRLGDPWGIAFASGNAGEISRKQGHLQQAKKHFHTNLIFYWKQGHMEGIPYPLEALSLISVSEKDYVRAVRLWGAAEAFREKINAPVPPAYQSDYQKYLSLAYEKLGEEAYNAARIEGREIATTYGIDMVSLDNLVQEETSSIASAKPALEFHLTKREVEILRLVAIGLTDAQAAERLFLSPRTISKHLQFIYEKLNVNSRASAIHFAIKHKIIEQ